MTDNRDQDFYHFVQRALDAEEQVEMLQRQLAELQQPLPEPEPTDDCFGLTTKVIAAQ